MKPCLVLAIVSVTVPCGYAEATEWHVKPDGSGDVPTIQDAVDASAEGDTIVLWPGDHLDADQVIPVVDMSVTFRAAAAAGSARIVNSALVFSSCDQVSVHGIAFATDAFEAAGLRIGSSGVVEVVQVAYEGFHQPALVQNCEDVRIVQSRFVGNHTDSGTFGGAGLIVTGGASIEIASCWFEGNSSFGNGGGVEVTNVESTRVRGNVFSGNMSGAGSAAFFSDTSVEFFSNTVVGNAHDGSLYLGGAVVLYQASLSVVHHNVFAFNSTYGLRIDESGTAAGFYCNAFYENPDADGLFAHGQWYGAPGTPEDDWSVILADPQFCDFDGGDYQLMSSSPLLPANFPADARTCSMTVGAFDGNGCVNPVLPTTWGRIKDRFWKQARSEESMR